jgi:Mg/Co/Ni transporter MgtE
MAPDDAADLIVEIDQERRGRVLALLPAAKRRRIETLLGYNPSTAGGLMSPDFVRLAPTDTVAAAIDGLRSGDQPPGTLTSVYLLDGGGRLVGSVLVVTLLRSDPGRPLQEIADREPPAVSTDAELPAVARVMTDYNLVMLPVLDEQQLMVGVVTVDDVLELTLPSGWRRRFGLVRD